MLVIGSPDAEPAQPRALIGGHVVSTLVGLLVLKLTGPSAWAAAAGVGLAVLAMYLTGTFHPPAGINPLLVISNNLPWSFLFVPVLAGALLLTAFASSGTAGAAPVLAAALALSAISPVPRSRNCKAVAVADQRELAGVERFQRRAVADRDQGGGRQLLAEQAIERGLRRLVEGGGRLIEEQEGRRMQQRARHAEALLLAERQHPVPVRLFMQPRRKLGRPTAASTSPDLRSTSNAPASAG